MKKIELYDAVLRCPECGHDYLHHEHVSVFARDTEDNAGKRIQIGPLSSEGMGRGASLQMADFARGVESGERRGYVEITFWCEGCHKKPQLRISQHKGCTHVVWAGTRE